MRSPAFSYRLGFALPADFVVTDGGPQPSPAGCTLQSFKNMVVITGPSRDAVFEKATELLRAIRAMTRQPMSIQPLCGIWSGRVARRPRPGSRRS